MKPDYIKLLVLIVILELYWNVPRICTLRRFRKAPAEATRSKANRGKRRTKIYSTEMCLFLCSKRPRKISVITFSDGRYGPQKKGLQSL